MKGSCCPFDSDGGEAMLLARDAQSQDWSVYLPASQGAVEDFLDVVAAQIGAP